MRKLSTLELNQQVTVNNLTLIYEAGGRADVIYRVNLSEGVKSRALQAVGRGKV